MKRKIKPADLDQYLKKLNEMPVFIYLKRVARILYDSFLAFRTNQVPVRAAALTFTTLLAFVPFFIILSSAASKLGYLELLSAVLPEVTASLNITLPIDKIQRIMEHAQNIKMGRLGVVGSIFLFISFLLAMSNLEKAMNIIWGIRKNRNWLKRVRDYIPFLLFVILFILLISWMLVRLKMHLDQIVQGAVGVQLDQNLQFGGIVLNIMVLCWFFIGVLYYMIPFIQVRIKSAVVGTTFATVLLFAFFYGMIQVQSLLFTRYSMLYGSLAIFPLIMVVLYISWIIILYGVTLTYAYQKAKL
ncbi:YihY/virulence factor BrkB family protein [Fibrobacterota bacterium]